MNRELIQKEYLSCKRNVVTFSILLGVSVFVMFLSIIIFAIVSVNLATSFEAGILTEDMLAAKMATNLLVFIFFVVISSLAATAFTPFLIINAVKQGKRRRLLNQENL